MTDPIPNGLLTLECVKCEQKFRRAASCDWNREFEGKTLCFECFVLQALGVKWHGTVIYSSGARLIADSSNKRLLIAARVPGGWYALAYDHEVVTLPNGTEFSELKREAKVC